MTRMVGWGGAAGLINIPGSGAIKPGFGRILTFALGAKTKLEILLSDIKGLLRPGSG